jgi:PEP-CTERM motif
LFFVISATLVVASMASATPLHGCPATNPLPYGIAYTGAGAPFGGPATITDASSNTSNAMDCGPVTAGGFGFANGGGLTATDWSGSVSLTGASHVPGEVDLDFDPNMTGRAGDLQMVFAVIGPIAQIDGSVTGTRAAIIESVCATQWTATGCSTGILAQITYTPASGTVFSALFPIQGIIYILDDIRTGNADLAGTVTNMTNSFELAPEPASMGLIGGGLLALGVLARKRSK